MRRLEGGYTPIDGMGVCGVIIVYGTFLSILGILYVLCGAIYGYLVGGFRFIYTLASLELRFAGAGA